MLTVYLASAALAFGLVPRLVAFLAFAQRDDLAASTQRVSLVQPPVDQFLRQVPEGLLDSLSRLGAGLVHTQDLLHKLGVLQHLFHSVLAVEPFGLVLQIGFAADDDGEDVVVAVSLRLFHPP